MPEVDEIDIEIKEEDLEIKACRASWAWGQHVNKTDSAIHITHIPTWISVFCQESRSQHKNKEKALQILRSKIYTMEEEKRAKERWEQRLAQIWSWDRSEKIRTYNFPQDRVTDHRIGQNFSGILQIMMWKLGPIIDALTLADEKARLEEASKIIK
jgi:peptide chain release factor 1